MPGTTTHNELSPFTPSRNNVSIVSSRFEFSENAIAGLGNASDTVGWLRVDSHPLITEPLIRTGEQVMIWKQC